jgi:hypothetical protein
LFEIRAPLRRIFGAERGKVVAGWKRLHNDELHNLCASRNIIKVIKSRRMTWAGHLTRIREMRNA